MNCDRYSWLSVLDSASLLGGVVPTGYALRIYFGCMLACPVSVALDASYVWKGALSRGMVMLH